MPEEPSVANAAGTSSPSSTASDEITAADVLGFSTEESQESPSDADEAASSAPHSDSVASSREPGATAQPAESAVEAAPDSEPHKVPETPPGPIPFERHQAALDNARKKERVSVEQELRHSLASQYAEAQKLRDWLTQNPAGFADWLNGQLKQHGHDAAPTDDEPALRSEDGIATYSAEQYQRLQAHLRQQILREVEEKLAPIAKHVTTVRERELATQVANDARGQIEQARKEWPLFSELEPDIRARMLDNGDLSFERAYIASYAAKGQTLSKERWKTERNGVMAEKTAAATTKPGQAPMTPKNLKDLSLDEVIGMAIDGEL